MELGDEVTVLPALDEEGNEILLDSTTATTKRPKGRRKGGAAGTSTKGRPKATDALAPLAVDKGKEGTQKIALPGTQIFGIFDFQF